MPNTNTPSRPPDWNHPRRCTAQKSDGSGRCTHYALRGTTVCKYHGGAAPQVQKAITARRMTDLYGPMFAALAECLASRDVDAILKSCAIISRHHLADVESGRLTEEKSTAAEWVPYLEADELSEIEDLLASYEQLARERMTDPGWRRAAVIDVIDVPAQPSLSERYDEWASKQVAEGGGR